MTLKISFKDVCSSIKKQGKQDSKLIEAVDQLMGLAIICSPAVFGPDAAALLPTLAVKNEMIKIGKKVFDKLTKKKDEDYLMRQDTMQLAYGLLVFTAFFDALDTLIPKSLREEIGLLEQEKAFLVRDSIQRTEQKLPEVILPNETEALIASIPIAFPHPTESLDDQTKRQIKLWKQMGEGFINFVQQLAFWNGAEEKKQISILKGVEKVAEEAAKVFEGQYFELARKFEDFAIWANLHEHKRTKARLDELSDYVKQHARLATANTKTIDVGFVKLHNLVLSIPETLRISRAAELVESLNKHYQARIKEPLIEDKEDVEEDQPRLTFPPVGEAFVPQAFRVLRQGGKARRLEEESTWSELPRRNDLGAFILNYLSSPYSTETPLLVLGHPGSGKSLLTTILSAQLMSKQYTAIRVPLREVNADADIVTQIEEAIRKITGVSIDSWIKLSAMFKNCPPLIILDGYDELLQASGQVFASYIKDAQRFQERETEQGRPLRIIITSRVTLIDKATVPAGSTIIRLLEFDKSQRDRWIEIWNKSNKEFFRHTGIAELALPDSKDSNADKILTLAEQPLLLLMLALYDSQGNQLRENKGLDRTKLYDSLLRRFVTRERSKEKSFEEKQLKDREKELNTEMQRLGVAALGMYNRRKIHILAPELDEDLAFFKLERDVPTRCGKALTQADLLLGSFFFIHKSKAQHQAGAEEMHGETAAFEFLHNTFGEFLTADFILRRAVAQVKALRASAANEALRTMFEKMMGTADGFERDWFASLVYTPLFTRPVVMEMIREWAVHVLKEQRLPEVDFVESLNDIVLNQIKRLLNKREMPSIIRKETAQEGYRVPFGDHPLLGHIAIYSMNLVLLRVIVSQIPLLFDENLVASHEDGTRPWDRLMHLWRSWFGFENLHGLTAVMLANRNVSVITIQAKQKLHSDEAKSRLHECLNIGLSLADNISSGLAGLLLFDSFKDSLDELDLIEQRLESDGFDIKLAIRIKRLLVLESKLPDSSSSFALCIEPAIDLALRMNRIDEIRNVCLIIARALDRGAWPQATVIEFRWKEYRERSRRLIHPLMAVEVAARDPHSGSILLQLGQKVLDYEWVAEFAQRFIELSFREQRLDEMLMHDEQTGLEWLRLLRDVCDIRFLPHFAPNRGLTVELWGRTMNRRAILAPREQHPEVVLAYFQILTLIARDQKVERQVNEIISRESIGQIFHPRHLWRLVERDSKGVLNFIRTIRRFGFGELLEECAKTKITTEAFEIIFHPIQFLDLSESNSKNVLLYIQILQEIGVGEMLSRFAASKITSNFFEMHFRPAYLDELFTRQSCFISVCLAIARLGVSTAFTETLCHIISRSFQLNGVDKIDLNSFSLSTLADLRWLAEQSGNRMLSAAVSELLKAITK